MGLCLNTLLIWSLLLAGPAILLQALPHFPPGRRS